MHESRKRSTPPCILEPVHKRPRVDVAMHNTGLTNNILVDDTELVMLRNYQRQSYKIMSQQAALIKELERKLVNYQAVNHVEPWIPFWTH